MHIKRTLLWILMLVLVSTVAFAGQCYVGGDCYIYHNVNDSTFDQVTINVTAENGTVVVANTNMTLQADTLYFITNNFAFGGNYTALIQVLNDSVVQSNTSKEFTVLESGGLLANFCPDSDRTMNALWFAVAFFVVLVIIGFSLRQMILTLFGGIGVAIAGITFIGCSMMLGLLMIFSGLILCISALFVKT